MNRTTLRQGATIRRTTLGVLAAALVSPSSAQDASSTPSTPESTGFDVVGFLAQYGVKLPATVASKFTSLTEQDQHQRLISLGVDRSILSSDVADRPMPLVAELLRVLDPDSPRPEIASDDDYARSRVDAAAAAVVADVHAKYSSRLGFARWESSPAGGRVLVIPVVGATEQETTQIQANVLPDNTSIRVEATDISYQDLRQFKDAVDASIRVATGNGLGDWSIGIDRETRTVFFQVDLSLKQNRKILAGISSDAVGATVTVDEGQTAAKPNGQQIKDLLAPSKIPPSTVAEGRNSGTQTGNLLAGLANTVRNAANSFVVAEIPSSTRSGAEMVTFAHAKMNPPDTDYRESFHIRGGEWIVADNGGVCTTNFLWKKGNEYRMGTAGHCSTTTGRSRGDRAYRTFDHRTLAGSSNGDIGWVTHNGWVDGSYSDYALMTLPEASTTTNRVMTTSGNWRTVTAVSALSNLSGTFSVCHVGLGLKKTHRLDKSCGTISATNIKKTITLSTGDSLTLYGLYCTTAKRAGGDSGAPHYLEIGDDAYAVGIHHGSDQDGNACFTTVQAAKARSGYSIVLN